MTIFKYIVIMAVIALFGGAAPVPADVMDQDLVPNDLHIIEYEYDGTV